MLTKSKKYKNILETRCNNACTIMFNRQIDNLGDDIFHPSYRIQYNITYTFVNISKAHRIINNYNVPS